MADELDYTEGARLGRLMQAARAEELTDDQMSALLSLVMRGDNRGASVVEIGKLLSEEFGEALAASYAADVDLSQIDGEQARKAEFMQSLTRAGTLAATPTEEDLAAQGEAAAVAASMDAAKFASDAEWLAGADARLAASIPDVSDRAFETSMERAAQMAADDSGSGIQKLPYIAGQSGGGVQQLPSPGPSDGGGGQGDWSAMEITGLASGLAGSALGVAAPWMDQDTAYEDTLARRAAGDTIARREGTLAAGQMQRGIMATSIGRRDISPGLALRNAQMAGGQAASDIMARAAIASAAERQAAENQLAKMRAERIGQSVNAGIAGLSQLGAFASSQAAAQKQDARAQRKLDAYRERTEILGLGRG